MIQKVKPMINNNLLLLRHEYAASSEAVFDAWANPDVAKQWLFKSDNNEILGITMDVRKGGNFSILELNKGKKINHFGTYLEINRPNKLVFTLEVPEHFKGVATIEIEIVSHYEKSELVFTESGIDTSKVEKNWHEMLDKLEEILDNNTAANIGSNACGQL
ncbi:MAG: SRPBCC domain-containing protein [Chitinophagaceae bacterium]|nr:SRPBCC domain-containing protein [Chitinophagaceae bacterium]